jgi:hypothetical protein
MLIKFRRWLAFRGWKGLIVGLLTWFKMPNPQFSFGFLAGSVATLLLHSPGNECKNVNHMVTLNSDITRRNFHYSIWSVLAFMKARRKLSVARRFLGDWIR